ncbi:putative ribonuclease H-like domain-containing protein, partial [Tanacetum coccineum]
FWATTKAKTINRERQIQALVDKKKVIITETSIRSDLKLEDAEGTECLPNDVIFEQLTLIGDKTTAWNEFSSTMASAIICLATNQNFNFSKYIFDNMMKNLEGRVKFLMFLRFVQVFLEKQVEGISKHKGIYVTPSHTKKVFANMKRPGEGFSGKVTPLFQTMMVQAPEDMEPITDEATNEEHVSTPSYNLPQSGEDRLQLTKLMNLCTSLQKKVLDLEEAKTAQAKEIASLKKKLVLLNRYYAGEVVTIASATTTVDELTLAKTLIEIKAAKPKAIITVATTITTIVASTRPKAKRIFFHIECEEQAEVGKMQKKELTSGSKPIDFEDDEGVGAEADMNNLATFMPVSPILTTRIHKDHPFEQIIRDLHSAPQTRRLQRVAQKVIRNKDPKWIEARIELLQFKLQQMEMKNAFLHDDIIFGYTKKSLCTEFEKLMHKKFQMSSIGELIFFLRLQVTHKDDGIFISQDEYVDEILKKFGFSSVKTASTPMETSKPLMKDENAEDVEAYADSGLSGASLEGRLISWQCKKQTIVANSTTEAEYVAASSCCGQVLWIQNQMLDYGYNFMNTKIFIDNESTICIVKNPVFHSKTKHIEIRHHFIRDSYEKRLIQVIKIHTDHNVADLLTKAFDVSRFQYLIASIGMLNL